MSVRQEKKDMLGRDIKLNDLVVYPSKPKSGPVTMHWGIVRELGKGYVKVSRGASMTRRLRLDRLDRIVVALPAEQRTRIRQYVESQGFQYT